LAKAEGEKASLKESFIVKVFDDYFGIKIPKYLVILNLFALLLFYTYLGFK